MKSQCWRVAAIIALSLFYATAIAATASQIDSRVEKTLQEFGEQVDGAEAFLGQAAGYLVFPRVVKAGIGIGIETGEGALRVENKTVNYYRTSSGSIGLQLGAQAKSIVIVFMTKNALDGFRTSDGWKAGVDGSIVLVDMGESRAVDSSNIKDPIVGFVFASKGLMYNLTLEGSKFSKLDK